jgi:hypothetical protein
MIWLKIAAAASVLQAAMAAAQPAPSANYTTVDVEPGKVARIGVYAQGRRDCSPTKLPIVRVVEAPLAGTLTVQPSTVTTSNIPACPNLQLPAQVVSYQGRQGYSTDHVLFSVTYPNGEIALHDVAIRLKEMPKSN